MDVSGIDNVAAIRSRAGADINAQDAWAITAGNPGVVVAIVVAGTTAGAGFFSVVSPTFNSAVTSVAIAAVAIVLFNRLYDESVAEAGPRGLVGFLIRKLEALDDSE